jgi:hypothetical protein
MFANSGGGPSHQLSLSSLPCMPVLDTGSESSKVPFEETSARARDPSGSNGVVSKPGYLDFQIRKVGP